MIWFIWLNTACGESLLLLLSLLFIIVVVVVFAAIFIIIIFIIIKLGVWVCCHLRTICSWKWKVCLRKRNFCGCEDVYHACLNMKTLRLQIAHTAHKRRGAWPSRVCVCLSVCKLSLTRVLSVCQQVWTTSAGEYTHRHAQTRSHTSLRWSMSL